MVLCKYGVQNLTHAHIYAQMVTVLFRYFRIYSSDDFSWLIERADVQKVFEMLLDTPIISYLQIAQNCGFAVGDAGPTGKKTLKTKPTCVEDLTECFEEGMSQKEKTEAIMKWWNCGKTTARNYMAKYGLTEKKYTRSDYKELHEHLDEVSEDLHEHIDEVSAELHTHIDNSTNAINESTQELHEHIDAVSRKIDEAFEKWLSAQCNHENRYY